MADNIRIDTHKLLYHPETVARWLSGENIYPIELELGLTNACNHRCIFCSVDYMGYKANFLDTDLLVNNLRELAVKGTKSVVYAGEGEPLLHKDAPYIINATKECGIDAAMSTNGVLLTPEVSKDCLKSLTWMRFSVAGIRESTYEKIQRGKSGDLPKVLLHMEEAVRVKKDQNLKTTLGVQLLLLPDNKDEIIEMGKRLKEIGVDYFTIKPYTHHPQSHNLLEVDYHEMLALEKEIQDLESEEFKIYFRTHAMKNLQNTRPYRQCWALPFMVYVDAKGNLWPCIRFMGKEEFKYGNLYEESFCQIWEGEHRKEIVECFTKMKLGDACGANCRLDEMNKYLDNLKNPGDHVNFI